MRILSVILAIACLVLLFSVVVCGLWIANNQTLSPEQVAESRQFHLKIGLAAAVACAALAVLVLAGKTGA